MDFVRRLDDVTSAHLMVAGPLAVELGCSIRAGLPIPSGFVLTTCEPPGDLDAAVLAAYHWPGWGGTVVVRCSVRLRRHAGAAVTGDGALVERVLTCRAFQPRPHAVVVQRAVHPERSGVGYVADERVMLWAGYGLPSAVTSGAVQPDVYLLAGQSPRMVRMWLGHQTHKMVRQPDGSERAQALAMAEADSRALSDNEAVELAGLAIGIGRHYQEPREFEWAIDGDSLWLLRSRVLRRWPGDDPRPRQPSRLVVGTVTGHGARPYGLASVPGGVAAPRR
jgi:pyruvate, water dikinase